MFEIPLSVRLKSVQLHVFYYATRLNLCHYMPLFTILIFPTLFKLSLVLFLRVH